MVSKLKIIIAVSVLLITIIVFFVARHIGATYFAEPVIRRETASSFELEIEAYEFEQIEQIDVEDAKSAERQLYINRNRARDYLETARNDYYHGRFDLALERLNRAKHFDSSNYLIFRLSGQIHFERGNLRRTFEEWELAEQLPHQDPVISRDVDMIRRLLRFNREEIDNLQRHVHKNPSDAAARARLRELRDQMSR